MIFHFLRFTILRHVGNPGQISAAVGAAIMKQCGGNKCQSTHQKTTISYGLQSSLSEEDEQEENVVRYPR